MLTRSLLALCAFGAVAETTISINTKNRRSTFLDIVNGETEYKSPILPVELPIRLGGHGGVNLPVLVLPVPVPVFTKSDSCEIPQNKQVETTEDSPTQPQFIIPPYIASRYQEPTDQSQGPLDTHPTPDEYQNDYTSPIAVDQDQQQEPMNYPEIVTPSSPRRITTESGPEEYLNYPTKTTPRRVVVTRRRRPITTNPSKTVTPLRPYQTPNGAPSNPEQPHTDRNYIDTNNPRIRLGTGANKIGFTVSDQVRPIDYYEQPTEPLREPEYTGNVQPSVKRPVRPQQSPKSEYNVGQAIEEPLQRSPEPVDTVVHHQPSSNEEPDVESVESVFDVDPIPYSKGRGQIFATTDELIQSYRRQSPTAPELPAVMPHGRVFPTRLPAEGARPEPPKPAPAPPRPRFKRSLGLRIDLMVPRSDYTEVYDMVWHAESNTVHTVVEDGSTVFHRVPRLDGSVQFLKIQEDRLNGTTVRRCMTSPLLPAAPADSVFPGLPDLSLFHFAGYTTEEGRRVEHWQNFVIGAPGEGGAARGESLNFTHDFFLYRDGWDAVPLRYTVVTHSSVLGPAIDSYTHRYRLLPTPTVPTLPDLALCHVVEEIKEENMRQPGTNQNIPSNSQSEKHIVHRVHDSKEEALLHLEGASKNTLSVTSDARNIVHPTVPLNEKKTALENVIGTVQNILSPKEELKKDKDSQNDLGNIIKTGASIVKNIFNPGAVKNEEGERDGIVSKIASAARDFFHPIGEFLGSTRPKKYDAAFDNFKEQYQREYRDLGEEAVRKAQFINTDRFVNAANRVASGFTTEINHLADRLIEEVDKLCGVVLPALEDILEDSSPEFSMKDTEEIMKSDSWPKWFDWRERGYKPIVFHQGETCASCWACAVAGATEGALFNKTNRFVQLSPQSMIDCGKPETNGCKPSNPIKGAEFVKKHGLYAWDDYKHMKRMGTCIQPKVPIVTRISGYRKVDDNERALQVAIHNYAPTMVIVPGYSKSFQSFSGDGVLDDTRCTGAPNHAVLAVGWGTENDSTYFTLRNSWGSDWAKGGYGKIKANSCTITKYAFYMVI